MTSENVESADALQLVGTTIADKYAIEAVVGQGGFATVYRATHVLWKRPVAVKVFTALGEVGTEQRQRLLDDFIQEGALLAELSERSTAICQARDVGMFTSSKGENVPYMVLEWLEGKPLEALVEEERQQGLPLRTLDQTMRLLEPVAEALALAHKKGIAHRDVKPANVFVLGDPATLAGNTDSAGVKLLDFGIAKVVQDAQKMGFGKTAGHITSFTPLYGAPEQFNRGYGATGPWTDVFALALVLAEVLSGREPMSGDNLMQLAFAASDPQRRPTPRTLGVTISDALEAVFLRAVAVRIEERFQTAGDFWTALRVAVAGQPVSAAFASANRLSATGSVDAFGKTGFSHTGPGPTSLGTTPPVPPSQGATAMAMAPQATPKSSAGLVAVVALVGLAVVGGGGAFLASKAKSGKASAAIASASALVVSASAPVSAVASAAPPPATCPPGMIRVPGGEFFMGSDEKDALDSEKPAHKVKLSPYCLDELEVSVAQYKECSDRGACRRAGKENVWKGILPVQQKIYDPLCNINDPVGKASHPINCVDWEQARQFCEARDGRLPTEAEWEFAARGPDGRIYPWGDEAPNAQLLNACGKECVAWQKKHPDPTTPPAGMYTEDDGFPNTAPVGSFSKGKSRYGIQDVVGNVWEWVADWHADYDQRAPSATAVDPKGPESGTHRIIRGGAWNGAMPSWVRPSVRYHALPTDRSYGFGFRCAKSL
ncbi:Adenylate cyclase [Labilithrix luteola]|uniref:Adenylate cyclase n=1 Tax=Labilithrix luteola TaxID=1391654 RepID=A0A0K1QBJ0_9BACT|nr:bifunctional serine/threonine-protein kinase/formylglycine-generating enzyme family protein [Labilithrix luteola]AKV03114.1 Adenylate cyclase [Labilithrix luteola]